MKPVIGVMPLWDEEKKSFWMLPGYFEGIKEAGGLPIMLPLTVDDEEIKELCHMCSGFLFTGGQDVCPEIYGEKRTPKTESFKRRDEMELKILRYAISNDMPALGICRGIQLINAAMGGSLYQDLETMHPSLVNHHMSAPYNRVQHKVEILDGTPLHDLLLKDEIGVNSYHHQAVKELAPSLNAMAISEDGLIEALYMPGMRYLWAVQWHPEFSYKEDMDSRKIFASFVDACKEYYNI